MRVEPHTVTANDDGIRPAGKPDECFYCRRKVGEKHKPTCAMVTVVNFYEVYLDGLHVGVWSTKDPASWDLRMQHFHKNEGSWCSNNMRKQGELMLHKGVEIPFDPEDSNTCTLCLRVELIPVDPIPLEKNGKRLKG
jgi:hypothetical protein